MNKLFALVLLGLLLETSAQAITATCVSDFTVNLQTHACPSNLGTVKFTLLDNGKVKIDITLVPNTGLTIQQVRLQLGTSTPKPGSGSFETRFTGNTFTSVAIVCGTTQKIAVAVQLVDSDGDTFFAWAVPYGVTLKPGVTFTKFKPQGFTGYFTVTFCPCTPSACCNPANFNFQCNNLQFCPASGKVPNNQCYCGNLIGGGVACLADRGGCTNPNPTVCKKHADCPNGFACQRSSCCGGQHICVQLCEKKFPTSTPCEQPPLVEPPSCCDAANFNFDCANLKFCPRTNPFKDSAGKNQCYCGNLLGGGVSCFADRGNCDNPTVCKKHADCPMGFVCQKGSCCGGQDICVQQCETKFPQSTPCLQPTPVEPSTSCCNPQGFKFNCTDLKFCPQSDPFKVMGVNKCYCGNIAGGGVTCLADRGTCDNPLLCTKNGDCPIGFACQKSTCCQGKDICIRLCQNQFPQAASCDQPALPPACCSQSASFKFNCSALQFCPNGHPFTDPATNLKCYCGTVAGGITCLADRGSCNNIKECTKNTDCPAGSACQLKSCCEGKNICVELCNKKFTQASECQNPSL